MCNTEQKATKKTNKFIDTDNSMVASRGEVGLRGMKRVKGVKYRVTEDSIRLWVVITQSNIHLCAIKLYT